VCIDNTDTFLCSLLLDAIGVLIVSYGKVPVASCSAVRQGRQGSLILK